MAIEIERKFLVVGEFKSFAFQQERIAQAYISSDPDKSVRVRIKGENAFLTIKGKSDESGLSRFEWEKQIEVAEAEELFSICEKGKIDKIRYYIKVGIHTFEVDVFYGENEGLVIAELELERDDEVFEKPIWLGKEVTGISKYYNLQLTKHPYTQW